MQRTPTPGATVAALALLGFLLRVPFIGDALFADETSTYSIVTGQSPEQILRTLHGNSVDLTPPLYFLATRVVEVVGSAPELLRVVPLAAGTAAIPLTYLVGVRTVGRRGAIVGAALAAVSPFLIYYSTEARAYMLLTALALISTLALLEALRTGRRAWWAAYAAAATAAMYTHFTVVFLLLGQFAWAFARRPAARKPLLVATAAAAAAFAPWLPAVEENADSPGVKLIGRLHEFTPEQVTLDLAHAGVGHSYLGLRESPGELGLALLAAALLTAAAGLALGAREPREDQSAPGLIVALALAAPIGLAAYSLIGPESVWDQRNLISSVPAMLLLLGALVSAAPGRARVAATGLLLAGVAAGVVPLFAQDNRRPDYDALAGFIEREGGARAPVVEDVGLSGPGPYSPMDISLRLLGRPEEDRRRPVYRLAKAPLEAVLAGRPYAAVPVPAPGLVARSSLARARGGPLFLVVPGSAEYGRLRADVSGPVREFLAALPPRTRASGSLTVEGFRPYTAYVLRQGGR